jgi:hypothetical protein
VLLFIAEFFAKFGKREGEKDVMAVIVQDPEIVCLPQILDYHRVMSALALLAKLHRHIKT